MNSNESLFRSEAIRAHTERFYFDLSLRPSQSAVVLSSICLSLAALLALFFVVVKHPIEYSFYASLQESHLCPQVPGSKAFELQFTEKPIVPLDDFDGLKLVLYERNGDPLELSLHEQSDSVCVTSGKDLSPSSIQNNGADQKMQIVGLEKSLASILLAK